MQSWDLDRKIQVTTARIMEWYEHYNGLVYVAFSGGKDSTVLLDLVRRIYPDVPAVFCDTGLEFPEIRQFAMSVNNVVVLRPEMNFKKVIETYGYPIVSNWTENDVLEYIHTYNIPYASVYGDIVPCGGGGQRQAKKEPGVCFALLALIWRSLQTVSSGSNSLTQSCGSIA